MADHSEYTTLTRYIPVGFFIAMIKGDIKKLIHTYGHKNCGLRQEELCEKIKEIIPQKKKIIFEHMDTPSKNKWSNEWNSERSKHFDKLYKEEGFINMCFPKKYTKNPSLDQLLSKHIDFCKKKDERRSAVQAKPEYSECVNYNVWIETQKTSFTLEYLENVKKFRSQTVHKYFSTKENPGGQDPLRTYQKSKLDCEIYNPKSKIYQKELVEKALTNKAQLPRAPNIRQESQGKDGKYVEDRDSASEKTKAKENIPPKSKSHTPDSQIHSPSKTQRDDTSTVHDTPVKTEDSGSPVNKEGEKKGPTSIKSEPPTKDPPTAQEEAPPQAKSPPLPPKDTSPTTATQSVHVPTLTTSLFSTLTTVRDTTSNQTPATSSSLTITPASSLNSVSPSPSDPLPSAAVNNDQDRASHLTTTSDTLATTHSTQTLPSLSASVFSLAQPQPPALNTPPSVTAVPGPGTPVSSSSSTLTTPVTTTTMSPAADTKLTMSTIQAPIPSTEQVPSVSGSKEPLPPSASGEPKETVPITDPQQTVKQMTTSLSGGDTGGVSVPAQSVTIDNNQQTTLSSEPSPKTKDSIKHPGVQSANSLTPHSAYTPSGNEDIQGVKIPKTVGKTNTKHNISAVKIGTKKDHDPSTQLVSVDQGKISLVKPGKDPKNNSATLKGKNDNPNIMPEEIPSLTHIIPTFLVILAILTLLYQLYKYTPFGFLLGRRRKKKKRDLRRIFEIPEKPTYESPNIAAHEWEDPKLVGKTVGNDIYIKLLKMKRYEQAIHKKKKKKKTTLIEVHMEVFEEYKNDEWELHKGDFLEICLRGFINEENETYQKFSNSELIVNNIKNEKTIEDIQKQEILWNNWIENHRNILEQWKEKEWFHILKNKWRNEQHKYKEKNNKLQENMLNEQETYSIVSQKEIWKQWISKQATLIDMFNKEDWFKSMVYVQNKEKNNYHINEYNNISVTSKTGLKNEKMNHENGRSKNIIQKLMVQIHMMVLEECIKEDIIKHKELCIDNFIEDIHNQNNYDEKRNITQCDTDDFNVLEFQETHTSRNK
ncbi:STP1 protein [Plasmodium ovale curtisi]|uniref:STP1 protein n=1 Tax=Plasmodium ovale curtisi TaxID=864141 RepID=A0A1A8WEL0_PLAOA|nr:STP1 protein [Plasmodium ovale curtisi]